MQLEFFRFRTSAARYGFIRHSIEGFCECVLTVSRWRTILFVRPGTVAGPALKVRLQPLAQLGPGCRSGDRTPR
jgi:hypothetical protein